MTSLNDQRAAINVEALQVRLGGRAVLQNVNTTVHTGEFAALIGPNGAGKTTLIRALLGLVKTTGSAQVHGRVGYVPQTRAFAWDFPVSVAQVVQLGLLPTQKLLHLTSAGDIERVERALDLVGMTSMSQRQVGELSGGQRQRVLLARALVTDPDVLILDEPFTGLDQPTIDTLTDLLQRLTESGKTTLMSTHDIGQALDTADRVILLNRTVHAQGHPRGLADPQVWVDAFGVRASSPLIATVHAVISRREQLAHAVEVAS
ncbi:metal ABC transporter ATP-binding protein [Gleimia hominis]|uniref:metal ABC transporter ATP-binding protein n=1 Tax=Gleimia hominis TaxID=595468 RepID=UPI000C7FFB5B|nr:ABC transporter ATP-binding protein [Gleimia hominis]WIK64552.1 ABC transporter ATP-binding protein [Gleimia hominis]